MKKNILFLALLTATTIATAQQLYIEGGKTMSSFNYENSQGAKLNNLHATSHSFMEIGYRKQYFVENLNFTGGIGYIGYGSIGSDDTVGNFMEWDLNYLELSLGADYELYSNQKFNLYGKLKTSFGYLVQGTQILNNSVFDVKNTNNFNNTLINYKLGLGVSYPIADNLNFYLQYMYGKSFDLDATNAKLKIASNNISFGLLINISKKQLQQN